MTVSLQCTVKIAQKSPDFVYSGDGSHNGGMNSQIKAGKPAELEASTHGFDNTDLVFLETFYLYIFFREKLCSG